MNKVIMYPELYGRQTNQCKPKKITCLKKTLNKYLIGLCASSIDFCEHLSERT